MNGEGQCKRVSIISMRMVVSKWVNVSSIWFLHLARCSILWLCNGLSFFSSRSVYHLASVWITEPWCLPPLRANEWMSGTASVPTATCEWVKECKCAIVNVRPVYRAILSLWNQITMWLNEHPLSEDTSEWVSVCASLCVRLLLMTYSYPCSYIYLLTNLGASGMSACALYSAKRCDHAIMKLLTFGAKSQFQQCAANRCRMAPHFSLHFQIVAFRFSESYNPRAQVRFVI